MKIGVKLHHSGFGANPEMMKKWTLTAEKLGFHLISVADHIGLTPEVIVDYPEPYYEVFTNLAWLAGLTTNIELNTSVVVIPYRHPITTAHLIANVDQLSGGRFIFGVGVGWAKTEFDALGISLKDRGSLTNESINILKELWTNENPSYSSSRWNFSDLKFSPKPLQKPSIPIWIGGASDGALARAARVGDGWHPSGVDPSAYSVRKQQIEELAESQNRDISHFTWSTRVEVQAHGKPSSERAAQRSTLPGDSSDQMIHGIAEYESSGADHIILAINSGDVIRIKELMHTISEEVMPSFL